jgi:hypothetical protein
MEKGARPDAEEPFKSAAAAIAAADSEGVLRLYFIVRQAAETDPRLALTLLERRAPEFFAKRESIDLKVDQTVSARGGVMIMTADPPPRDGATDATEDEDDEHEDGPSGVVLLPPKQLDA